MRFTRMVLLILVWLAPGVLLAASASAPSVPSYVSAAVSDAARTEADRARDAGRHPAELLSFAGVKPGDHVVDVGPGNPPYFVPLFSRIVGDKGQVTLVNPDWLIAKYPQAAVNMQTLHEAGYHNLGSMTAAMETLSFDKPVDMVFMSQLYHDQLISKVDMAKMNAAIFKALKPGGVYLIIDHVGPGVTTPEQISALHRIDPELVKEQLLAAGFKLEAHSELLHHPEDDHSLMVFNPAIRGKTDQFIYKFRKPKK